MKHIIKTTEYWFLKPVSYLALLNYIGKMYIDGFNDQYYYIRIKTSGLEKISWVIGYENESHLVSIIGGGELNPELIDQLEEEFQEKDTKIYC